METQQLSVFMQIGQNLRCQDERTFYLKIAVKTYSDEATPKAVSVFRNEVDKIVILANSLQKKFKYILRQFKQTQMAFHSAILLNVQ
ncbi:MAG: hypothetical protein ACJAWV_001019 [Flammeovirgaceae bacterium]|jgi:hypothetical protein